MLGMANWSFLTNHARVMLCIAHDPGVRLRDIAAALGITERSAYGIVTDLTEGGYIVKEKRRGMAVATATRSRHISRCERPSAGNARSARCWTSSPTPTLSPEDEEGVADTPGRESSKPSSGL